MRFVVICWIALLCALPARAADRVMDVLDKGETPEQAAARLHKQAIKEDRGARDGALERRWNAEAASLRVDAPSGPISLAPAPELPQAGFEFGRRDGERARRDRDGRDRDGEGGGRGSKGGDKGGHDDREHHDREHRDRDGDDDGERDD